jgi:hypothetical protein
MRELNSLAYDYPTEVIDLRRDRQAPQRLTEAAETAKVELCLCLPVCLSLRERETREQGLARRVPLQPCELCRYKQPPDRTHPPGTCNERSGAASLTHASPADAASPTTSPLAMRKRCNARRDLASPRSQAAMPPLPPNTEMRGADAALMAVNQLIQDALGLSRSRGVTHSPPFGVAVTLYVSWRGTCPGASSNVMAR